MRRATIRCPILKNVGVGDLSNPYPDHFQEVQGQCASHERMAQIIPEPAAARLDRNLQTQTPRILELLRHPWQLRPRREVNLPA